MRLALDSLSTAERVLQRHLLDYFTFWEAFRRPGECELHLLQKFIASRLMIERGLGHAYLNARLVEEGGPSWLEADVVGEDERGELLVGLCETGPPTERLINDLRLIIRAENAKALLVFPSREGIDVLEAAFWTAFRSGKFLGLHLSWRELDLEEDLKEAVRIMELVTNLTRIRILSCLLDKPHEKRHFRTRINPKLLYENLRDLTAHRLVDELEDGTYALTPLGAKIMGELFSFLERVRRALEAE